MSIKSTVSCRSSPEDHRRTSLTSFSTISSTSSSPETREKVTLSFYVFFPKNSMDELGPIYTNTALCQQAVHCSCSPHRRWASPTPHHLPFVHLQLHSPSMEPFRVSSPLMTKSFKTPMHVESITWNDIYTLLETQRNKSHPKPRPELPTASSTVSHGPGPDSPTLGDGRLNCTENLRRRFFASRVGQSISWPLTVRGYYSSLVYHLV
jgi:hypothetical protein